MTKGADSVVFPIEGRKFLPRGDHQSATAMPARVCGRCQIASNKEVTARMAAKEGYCVKCKAKREMKDAQEITMKNGRPASQGICPECGTKIFKIGKS